MPSDINLDEWVDLPDDPDELLESVMHRGWGDGLPVIPPTRERVEVMVGQSGIDPDEKFPEISPSRAAVTVEKIAANAVMAGCVPELFPVVVAAMRTMLATGFNHEAMQSTTHPTAPLVIVHGPMAEKYAGATGALGPGHRANATTGRAIRLCLMNIGRARPGDGDYATQASPTKYAYCFAENAKDSPWEAFHVSRGLDERQSAITLLGAEGPHHVNDHSSTNARGILSTVASMVSVLGSNTTWLTGGHTVVVLGPEHAKTVADSGFSRQDVQAWLFEKARIPASKYKSGGMWGMQIWPSWKSALAEEDLMLCPLDSPENFHVVVAGGPGRNSAVIPGDGLTRCVTVPI